MTVGVYDGWDLALDPASPSVASKDWRLNGQSSDSVIARYTWGLDLSESLQGAGGIRLRSGSYGGQVGGLLAVDKLSGTGTSAFCGFDGNGNLGQLVDTSDGTLLARYEYAPYGREMRATGTLADWNRIRFSTKYLDPETDLYYYGYRWYSPGLGRWMSRDPVSNLPPSLVRGRAEGDALHPVVYVSNEPIASIDLLGLLEIEPTVEIDWHCVGCAMVGDPGSPGALWSIPSCVECILTQGASPVCAECVEAVGSTALDIGFNCTRLSFTCYETRLSDRVESCPFAYTSENLLGLPTCCYETGHGHVDCVIRTICPDREMMRVWERIEVECPSWVQNA